ncbi:peroxiredoxin [Kushneria pakistanensis]|uniref:thioredoxin-dependent peroxiredoxin n=1 Tax=Kushneria pakistanensis TaxID=1508770 RepID=A0ABQ3FB51_9GAMM|nr:peroxiredoxin [Kushneria pakistanensis]GHC15964.1 peroxiredoxin [Kushneria pakistanensis]
MSITIGMPAPDITLEATSATSFNPAAFKGKQVVLYFYPKDATPGCTTEGQDFRDRMEAFEKAGTHVFGVSRDTLRRHENFKEKQGFPFELVSDPQETLCRAFDVIRLKKLYGKEHEGIERSTFLIDREGNIAAQWRKVKVAGHADEVLAMAQALDAGQ